MRCYQRAFDQSRYWRRLVDALACLDQEEVGERKFTNNEERNTQYETFRDFFFFFCGGFSPFINAIDNVVGHLLVVFMVQPVHRLDSLPVVIGVTFWLVPVVHSCNWKVPFFNSQFNVKVTEKQFICYFLKLTR